MRTQILAAGLAALLAGCFSSASKASSLAYTDPPATSGWRLVRDSSSTSSRLVLGLVGPAGVLTRGVGVNLRAPKGVRFAAFEGGLAVEDGGVYELRSVDDGAAEPVAIAAGLKDGNVLSAGVFQKDRRRSAKDSGATLLRVALELDPPTTPVAGTSLALTVLRAAAVPEDIGQIGDQPVALARKLALTELDVAVGALEAR
jgi:hypothetical protein